MADCEPDRADEHRIVIRVGNDYWRCRAWVTGLGECLAFVPLPMDGSPPAQCWRGHYQPWYGTFVGQDRRPATRSMSETVEEADADASEQVLGHVVHGPFGEQRSDLDEKLDGRDGNLGGLGVG